MMRLFSDSLYVRHGTLHHCIVDRPSVGPFHLLSKKMVEKYNDIHIMYVYLGR